MGLGGAEIPLLMSGMKAAGGLFGGGGAAAAPAAGGTPFDAAFKPPVPGQQPPMPAPNPLFHDDKGPAAPAKVIAGANDPNMTPYDLIRKGGQTNESVRGVEEPLGFRPPVRPAAMSIEGQAPAGGVPPLPMANENFHDVAKTSAGGGLLDMAKTPSAPSPIGPFQTTTEAAAPKMGGLFSGLIPDSIKGPISTLQDKLGESTKNPLFQVGMGLLQSGYDGSNPYANIQKGLGGIQPAQIAGAKADQEAADKAKEAQLEQLLLQLGLKFGGGSGGTSAPPPSRQAAGAATLIR